ncbi:anti-sigma factor family protein [Candidatus Hydrogenedentota bacterium]
MNCLTIREMLVCYLDGDLSPGEEYAVASHLETCWTCREELEAVTEISNAVTEALASVCVRTDWEGLEARIDRESQARLRPRRRVRKEFMTILLTPARILVSAAAVVAVVGHVGVFISGSGLDQVEEKPAKGPIEMAASDNGLDFNLDGDQPLLKRRTNELKAVLAGVDVFEKRIEASMLPTSTASEVSHASPTPEIAVDA